MPDACTGSVSTLSESHPFGPVCSRLARSEELATVWSKGQLVVSAKGARNAAPHRFRLLALLRHPPRGHRTRGFQRFEKRFIRKGILARRLITARRALIRSLLEQQVTDRPRLLRARDRTSRILLGELIRHRERPGSE